LSVRLRVRVTPRSGEESVAPGQGGVPVVRVTAVPEGGKANAAVGRVVAKAVGVPKSAVRVVAGGSARIKTLEIDGADPESVRRLTHPE
jgi:uncharacterized protein YggU (UPF0235/DUF167 family)